MKSLILSSNLIKLVSILNDGDYHDCTTIGETLKMTRSAVWKMVKKLEDYQVNISSVKGKGYALQEPFILLNKQYIKKNINIKKLHIEIFESITSTNDYLKSLPSNKVPAICLAEQQTQGKGRLQRSWYSPFGQNIYLSFRYIFPFDISKLSGLSLVISLAVVETLKQYATVLPVLVKWPNDVYCQDKKLSGNLIELQVESHGTCCAIIGIGININMLSANKQDIMQPWISMREIIGDYIDRNKVIASLINNLFSYLQQFETIGLSAFIQEWKNVDYLFNKQVTLKGVANNIQGIVKGIDEQGQLLMQLNNGTIRAYSSGDTEILK